MDVDGRPLGYVVQTSPASDAIIGYSGPTNTLIALDTQHRILGLEILRCGDTPDHLQAVLADRRFLKSFDGLSWQEAAARGKVDGVSGATLTSLAIVEGIVRRLGGTPHSYRFPDPVTVRGSPAVSAAGRAVNGVGPEARADSAWKMPPANCSGLPAAPRPPPMT